MDRKTENWIKNQLRRASIKFGGPRSEAMENARRDYSAPGSRRKYQFQCNSCQEWFWREEVQVDHVYPVEHAQDWNEYMEILFCGPENLQVLCEGCHLVKTEAEKQTRLTRGR